MQFSVEIKDSDVREFLDEMLVRKLWIESGMDSPFPTDRVLFQVVDAIKRTQTVSSVEPIQCDLKNSLIKM